MKKKLLSFLSLTAIAILAFAATQASRRADAQVLWQDATGVAVTWSTMVGTQEASVAADWKVGDILQITVTAFDTSVDPYPQVGLKLNIEGWPNVSSFDVTLKDRTMPYVAKFYLTADMVEKLKANQFFIGGTAATVTKLEYVKDESGTDYTNAIWIGESTFASWSDWFAIDKSAFANAKAGDKVEFRLSEKGSSLVLQPFFGGWGGTKINTGDNPERFTIDGNVASIILTADEVTALKADGMILQGADFTIRTVALTPMYAVNIADGITNGTVAVDKPTAAEGEEVTITATPAEGYKLASLSVRGVTTDLLVTVTDNKFKMPADAVTVSATFAQPEDITISPASGDITAALKAATTDVGKVAKNITINLAENGAYTVSAPIVAANNLTINGAAGATIDASGNAGDFITLQGSTEFAKKADDTNSDHYLIAAVSVSDVIISGLKGALITDAQKTLLQTLTISNAVVEMPAAGKNVINFNGKGYVGKVVVKNSTIWANGMNTGFFAQYGSRPKNVNGDWLQEFDVQNSTIVNIANGKNICDLKQNGTAQNVYTLKNNIFIDCGKSGDQVVVGFNKGQTSATPVWDVDKNAFNWGGADKAAAEVTKAGQKDGKDIVKNSVPGVVAFANADYATTGNFKLANCAQNTAHIGDPRWLDATVEPEPENIVVVPEENADISTALYNATTGANKKAKDISVYLAPGKKFTISQTIEAPAAFVIMGAAEGTNPSTIDENATMAEIDASALDGPMVLMSETPAVAADANGFYPLADVGFLNVKVTGLAHQLFYANKQKYLINCFHVDFCNINIAGGSKTIIDTNGGGVIATLDMSKNTIWANPENTGALYSSQSGDKATAAGLTVQTFNIERNTMYNIAKGKNICTNRQSNQTWLTYNVIKNVFVNCGKSGQAIKGINGGSSGPNPTWNIDGNAFNFGDADTSAGETTDDEAEPVKNSLAGIFAFTAAATGDFNGVFKGTTADAPAKYPGDPRWTYTYEAPPAKFYIIGDMNSWDRTAMTEMTFNAETQAYEYEYAPDKAVYLAFADKQLTTEEAAADADWAIFNANNRYALGAGNVEATLGEAKPLVKGDGTIVLKKVKEGTSYKISVAKDLSTVTITGEAAVVLPYVVAGNSTELFGTAWDATIAANELKLNAETGLYELKFTGVNLSAGNIEYKVVKNGIDWLPADNMILNIPAAGTYDVTFTINPSTNVITGEATVATGIGIINVDGVNDIFSDGAPVYNLKGERIFKGYKGIAVKNGKKVVIK